MNKIRTHIALIMSFSFLFSCKKNDNEPVADKLLTTDVYTVSAITKPTSGKIFVAPYDNANNSGMIMILDEKGNVLEKHVTTSTPFNFKKWVINGVTRYTYFVNDPNVYHVPTIGQATGYVVIADSNFNAVNRAHLVSYTNSAIGVGDLDLHDFILLSDDHYITQSFVYRNVTNIPDSLHPTPNGVGVVDPVIQEVDHGTVIWQWSGTDHPEFYANSMESNNFSDSTVVHDYMHMNSMYVDPRDNNLICSFRNQDQVVKLNRSTGAIMWRLGGKNSDFALAADQKFIRQHNATFEEDGTLMLFDNGDIKLRPYSRVVELQLNETGRTVMNYKSFNIPEPFTQFTGSVQRTGDVYFIGGGTADYVLEINYVTGEKILELKGTMPTYRAFKYPNVLQ